MTELVKIERIKELGFALVKPRLRTEEWVTLVFFIFAAFFMQYHGVSIFSGWTEYVFFFMAMLAPAFLGIVLLLCFLVRKSTLFEGLEENPFTRIRIKELFRTLLTLFFSFYAYSHLKTIIPLVNSANYDNFFEAADKFLFFGYSPTLLLLKIKGGWVVKLMFYSYASFYVAFCLSLAVAFLQKSELVMRKLVLGILLIYIIGIAGYYLFPAWAPLFTTPELFAHIPNKYRELLWNGHLAVQANPAAFKASYFLGVAAFPSLHGAHFLFLMLVAYYHQRPLFYVYIPWGILLYVSTIFMGWHYVVDLIAGVLIAFAAVFIVNGVMRGHVPDSQNWAHVPELNIDFPDPT